MPESRIIGEVRRLVEARAHDCCEYCRSQSRYATQSFSVEHILARARGGETTAENLALACQGCNNHKYDKMQAPDPVTGRLVPLFHPRRMRWEKHFAWGGDFTLIVGISPTGRATVEALSLNRPGVVNLRRVLYRHGEHPPPIPANEGDTVSLTYEEEEERS
jgi:hypothetical protein